MVKGTSIAAVSVILYSFFSTTTTSPCPFIKVVPIYEQSFEACCMFYEHVFDRNSADYVAR